ncbi:divergent polysaccharide deacetylase family protein [Nitrosophilus labii]|uniref:divergent polysaccharide deacetylase family protein n=1 Tax=Nitrosophilus labii TaxID=2706014 RepID=UPI0016573605|nr:divergent polysaccharide deacetylase family protein [Nitrosophilus labii]
MAKRKKRAYQKRKTTKKFNLQYLNLKIFFLILVVFLFSGISGYIFYKIGFDKGYEKASLIAKSKIEAIKNEENRALQKHLKEYMSEIKDYKQNVYKEIKEKKEIEQKVFVTKPKLAIIIDDVAFYYQVKELKSLDFPINPSLFPPSNRHPNTPKYAKEFKFYMVHLPLEAKNFSSAEAQTLLTTSTYNEIEDRIKYIKKWFPEVKYLNNHTGSAFTADKEAMKRLITVLRKYGLKFIDSRTTALTKVEVVEKEFGEKYLARDVFLDNEQNIDYIKGQLKKAVKIAKKRGYAIAIGHPHPKTIEALRKSKDILKEVKLVYIDELDIKH